MSIYSSAKMYKCIVMVLCQIRNNLFFWKCIGSYNMFTLSINILVILIYYIQGLSVALENYLK